MINFRSKSMKSKDKFHKGASDRLASSCDCMYMIMSFLQAWKVLKLQRLSWRFYHKIVPRRLES